MRDRRPGLRITRSRGLDAELAIPQTGDAAARDRSQASSSHRGYGKGRNVMQLKRFLILAVLVAGAAILGKAGVHGGPWFNFTW